ncbi:hypothetical protein Gotri_023458 [Gossypium trilobum]|uniref:Uncharacterized protein n=1 Tax=Gossypium trilobum TaxID=34281 RepID=A0A7J9DJJ7_9ROSI|nr:hypothetical protein [Gossypium trilobum]
MATRLAALRLRSHLLRNCSTLSTLRSPPSISHPAPPPISTTHHYIICVAGFVVLVLNNFQDQLVFYVTPTDALEKYTKNPSKTKFRLGGLVLEGSVVQPSSSKEMEFVITDLITDILVRYEGSLPDLFREGHSVVVEGFVKPFTEEIKRDVSTRGVSSKARSGDCYFSATEVLAKHDEKYMPQEVAAAIEKNKKMIEDGLEGAKESVA